MMLEQSKIAILLPNLMFGGGERVSLALANALTDLGVVVEFVLLRKEGELVEEAEGKFRIVDLRCGSSLGIPFRLLRYVVSNRPHAVISNYWNVNVCACLARMLFPSFKLLVCEHSPPSKTPFIPLFAYRITATLLYRAARKVIAVSIGVADDVRGCTRGLSSSIEVIYNAINPDRYLYENGRTNRGCSRRKLINVGRLKSQKNQALLLEAFAIVASSVDAELMIVGDGDLRGDLEAQADRLGIADRVQFTGYRSDPGRLMAQADLFVLSSDYEGLPTVLVEALYAGLAIVSTDCPHGPREILMGGEYGVLCDMQDKQSLADAIVKELATVRSPAAQQSGAIRFLPRTAAEHYMRVLGLSAP
jgi:glycosyltransferase involved in cell wall biosynthesis